MHFFTVFPDDWIGATTDLTTLESGAYWNLICHYMAKDGCVPDDDRVLARVTKLSLQGWRKVRTTLLDGAFIEVRDGFVWQEKCEERLKKDGKFSRKQAEKSQKRWRQKTPKTLNGNETADAPAYPSLTPTLTPKESSRAPEQKSSRHEYAFEGVVIRLTVADFDAWRATFHTIPDLGAELRSIDAWCAQKWPEGSKERKGWFHRVPAMLNRTHQTNLGQQAEREKDPAAEYWREIEAGVIH